MKRKLFLNKVPTYQEDPSFYAERIAGVLPNVYNQTITENGNYQQSGNFTGVDITVNIPSSVPQCDRVRVDGTVVMLSQFSEGPQLGVAIPQYHTLVILGSQNGIRYMKIVIRNISTTSYMDLQSGVLYYVFSGYVENCAWCQNENGDLFSVVGQSIGSSSTGQSYIQSSLMTFSR